MLESLSEKFQENSIEFLRMNLGQLLKQLDYESKTHDLYLKVLNILRVELEEIEIL